jgi:hypothetical protein
MGLLYRKAQASIKSRPSRSGGGGTSDPVDESLARHTVLACVNLGQTKPEATTTRILAV